MGFSHLSERGQLPPWPPPQLTPLIDGTNMTEKVFF